MLKAIRLGDYKSIDRELSTSCCGGEVINYLEGGVAGRKILPGAALTRDEIWSNQKTEAVTATHVLHALQHRDAFHNPIFIITASKQSCKDRDRRGTVLLVAC